jgi:DNA polymerase I
MTPTSFCPSVYLIDGNSYVYRAFHALPYLSNSKGQPTHAVLGFTNMLLKILKERQPDYLAIAFDHKGKTLRHQVFESYKIHRPPMPEGLSLQLPYIYKLVEGLRIPLLMMEGYEADDILATVTKKALDKGYEVTIVASDKDILQLVGPSVRVYDPMKEAIVGEPEVRERFGVRPDQVVEVMGLMGDASDNIPGVPGVGEKTAISLIQEFGSIEALKESLDRIQRPKLKETLKEHMDLALLSRQLATLHAHLPVEIEVEDLKRNLPNEASLMDLFRELEFYGLLRGLFPSTSAEGGSYGTVLDEAQLTHLAGVLKEIKGFGLSLEADSKDAMRARIVGVAFAPRPGEAYYVPLNHGSLEGPARLSEGTVWKALKPILEDERYEKYGQNLKFHLLVLKRAGIALAGLAFDPMVASYLLAPHKSSHDLEDLALDYLNWRMKSHEELIRGRESRFDEEGITEIAKYSCARADAAIQLVSSMKTLLAENELEALFQKIEMPLIEVLAAIESNGFKIDVNLLHSMSLDLEKELANLEVRIFDLAKGRFNINSPKQLSEVLFARLGLNPIRKTKTGYSTDIDVLEQLAHVHPLPAQVLQYRSLAKLKSTYVDVLPRLLHSETGRVHTSLNQTVTATGRLSSTEPNLQNIPIRTELGRRIREAFIPEKGCWLLSADYSQIELRILAHLSGDQALIEAFRRDEDVHARTASEIFGVAAEEVSPEMRRMAKTINFGIIYGMSPYGLSTELGVSQAEAKSYIDEYFSHYRGVKAFIEELLEKARASGWVKTILGRRRFIPHIQSRDAASRQLGERMAINTPIQGSAADLIKQAMVSIHRSMRKTGCRAKMILQVHDELVFEVPEEERGEVEALVRREMEGVIHLKVSIRVDIGVGRNWREAHP